MRASKGIILAADVSTIGDLSQLAEISSQVPEVVAIKVGFSLALRKSLRSVVSAVNEVCNLPVIYDHQKAGTDIPATQGHNPFAIIGSAVYKAPDPRTALEQFAEEVRTWMPK